MGSRLAQRETSAVANDAEANLYVVILLFY